VEAFEDQLICVTVVNNMLSEAVAIHWHGVHMRGYPAMDGVYGVTQAGISPQGGRFTYRFRSNPGTHFWHAHMQALQMDRGLKGAIVIHPRKDPHAGLYQAEKVVQISDEWPNPEVCLKSEGAQPGNPVCAEIEKASFNGQWGDGSKDYPWPLVTVERGTCYRLRFIGSMGQTQNFLISLAGHNMTLIAVDGIDVEPVHVSQFNLHAGERADVVVCADQAVGNYLLTATYDLACFLEKAPAPKMPKVDSCTFWAFLHYTGASIPRTKASHKLLGGYRPPEGTEGGKDPKKPVGIVWNTNLQSSWAAVRNLKPETQPAKADVTYVLDVGVAGPNFEPGRSAYGSSDRMYMFTEIKPWKKPATPLLHTKGQCGADGVPFLTVNESDTVVELIINNLSPTAHVLHMHGTSFAVVNYASFSESWCSTAHFECFFLPLAVAKRLDCSNARAGDPGTKFPYDAYWGCPYDVERDNKSMNLEAPLLKDMISLWRRSWAVIRFRADNPGTWIFHCHMEQHIPTGQIMAFNILPSRQPRIPSDVPTEGPCPVVSWASADKAPTGLRSARPQFMANQSKVEQQSSRP
jgi:FtsP/CotA-like multicopper oxidase with cupredoxin domain